MLLNFKVLFSGLQIHKQIHILTHKQTHKSGNLYKTNWLKIIEKLLSHVFQEVYVYTHICTTHINSSTHSYIQITIIWGVWRRRIVKFIQDPDIMQFIDLMQITTYLSQPQESPQKLFFPIPLKYFGFFQKVKVAQSCPTSCKYMYSYSPCEIL